MISFCAFAVFIVGVILSHSKGEYVGERLSKVESMLYKYIQVIEFQSVEMQAMKQTLLKQQTELGRLKLENGVLKRNQADQASILRTILSNVNRKNEFLKLDKEDATAEDIADKVGIPIQRASRLLSPPLTTSPSSQTPAVGFHAYLGHSEANPGQHHIIAFDVVKTNVQNGYNKDSGVFTCQTDGLYGFIYALRMHTYGAFELVKNSEVLGTIFVNVYHLSGQMSTGSAVVSLKAGDTVYVRTHTSRPIGDELVSDSNGWPHFSGWLISTLQ